MLDLTTGTIVLAGFVSLDRFQNDLQDLQRKFFRSSEYYEVASRITRAGADAAMIVSAAAQRGRWADKQRSLECTTLIECLG